METVWGGPGLLHVLDREEFETFESLMATAITSRKTPGFMASLALPFLNYSTAKFAGITVCNRSTVLWVSAGQKDGRF